MESTRDDSQRNNMSQKTPNQDSTLFFNRELSLLEFNRRVLEQTREPETPILEQLRFLTISTSNLDEFFEVRVASLKEQVAAGLSKAGPDGLSPRNVLRKVSKVARKLVADQYETLNKHIIPALETHGVRVLRSSVWTPEQRDWVRQYFTREVQPVVTPMGLDPAHPFPKVLNKSLNFIVSLEGRDAFGRASEAAVVQAPRILPRLIRLPPKIAGGEWDFILFTSVIHAHVNELFPGMNVRGCHQFRVTRNSDLWIDEEETEDLLIALKGGLVRRNFGDAVRLEVTTRCDPETIDFLVEQFEIDRNDLFEVDGPVNLNRLSALYDLVDRPDLKFPPFLPGPRSLGTTADEMFNTIRSRDYLLHHPYQSFTPVVELVRQAARDPKVLAIKQTLYRTGGMHSPLAKALLDAANLGKEVTAVIELRARFDEADNIDVATRLQERGANVVYGVVGHKTHAKMLLIVRREGDVLRRYVHLGTGNYHTGTTRTYTDFGLLTANEEIGEDVHNVFQQLTGLGKVVKLKKLLQSPFTLHPGIIQMVEEEAKNAREGRPARIAAKMNALIDPDTIQALYRASQAGVSIDLIVRGICCLRPGVPGLSENIRVRSIVGRFLEHSRIFIFHANGKDLTWCASADWMPRNFFGRVEVCFPILDPELKNRVIHEGIELCLKDNAQAWKLLPDGSYEQKICSNELQHRAQQTLLTQYSRRLA